MGQRQFKQIKKYVVLQYLDGAERGTCFWTTAEMSGGDNTQAYNHESVVQGLPSSQYRDDSQEAIDLCARRGRPLLQEEAS
jgi:hypothetical protein